jgi:hypothetical protein
MLPSLKMSGLSIIAVRHFIRSETLVQCLKEESLHPMKPDKEYF